MTLATKLPTVTIDLDDVHYAGGVKDAIVAYCATTDTIACGTIGPEFSTSGPGDGGGRTHDAGDFAARALDSSYGYLYYLDSEDGRVAYITSEEGDELDWEWTEKSVVCLECPSIEDAVAHPVELAMMAKYVIKHWSKSDIAAWRKLIASIRDASAAIEDVDTDDWD